LVTVVCGLGLHVNNRSRHARTSDVEACVTTASRAGVNLERNQSAARNLAYKPLAHAASARLVALCTYVVHRNPVHTARPDGHNTTVTVASRHEELL